MPGRKEMLSQRRKCNKSFSLHEYQSVGFFLFLLKEQNKQESIPVGCAPPAYQSGGGSLLGGSLLRGLCPGESLFRDGGLCWGGVYVTCLLSLHQLRLNTSAAA